MNQRFHERVFAIEIYFFAVAAHDGIIRRKDGETKIPRARVFHFLFGAENLSDDGGDGRAYIVGPDDDREEPIPEREVQETDREKPSRKPESAQQPVMFDFDFFHTSIIQQQYNSHAKNTISLSYV
jgi:hypothetical protein